jgi:LPS-assembly protein
LVALSRPYSFMGGRVVPKLAINWAHYALDQPIDQGIHVGKRQITRFIPTFSLDNSWVFEKNSRWFKRAITQTLEPRVLYVRTPYRPQLGLPTFDTTVKDFNVDSIYADNAFSGVDRVSDAHQMTFGLTSRFINAQSGTEGLRLGLAQRLQLKNQRVTPDDKEQTGRKFSDLLLFGSANMTRHWYLDSAAQYNYEISRIVRSTMAARYSPSPYRTVSMAYRFNRGVSEQAELAWQWPLYGGSTHHNSATCGGAWYSAARVNYNLRERRITDSVLALEYDSSCWVGRLVAKRLSTNKNEANTSFGFEIEFVGLSRLGVNSPLQILRDNIPGYTPIRRQTPTQPPTD